MTEKVSQRLNPFTLPLFGERLIEASAGTGKTFTVGVIYLRLLLGLGQNAAFYRALTVKEILVVTFTESATEELRWRIRNNIHDLRLACLQGKSLEPLFSALLDEINNLPEAAAQLLAAERQIDEAAIYTIHGFCWRMLTQNAFESGTLFEQTLVRDELPLQQQACADFWRRYCYPLPLNIARVVSQEWDGPEALLSTISKHLHGEAPMLRYPPKAEETVLMRHEQIVARIDAIKAYWQQIEGDLETLIYQSGIDKRSYSSKHVPKWLSRIRQWAMEETFDYQLPKELDKFRQSVLLEKTKTGDAPRHALFTTIDELFATPLTLRDLIITRALSEVRLSIQQENYQHATLGFNDLISLMDSALHNIGGEQFAQIIRQYYPVAMIDEFQDTDQQQYRIFQKIYVGQSHCGLLLIGDPKQAIYAFRGADIFTYMRARAEISAHYTLEVNWRSSPEMVASVNKLFCQLKTPFLFNQIPFSQVNPAKKNQSLVFRLNSKRQPAMRFWLQQGAGITGSDYQKLMARLCATKIRDWLIAGEQGQARLDSGQCYKPVQASNITVLVRNRNEAILVRDSLSALSIPSVYLSSHDSIFDTQEAKDLLWLLQAVLVPNNTRELRSAMATSLIGLDAYTLSCLIHDELAWGALVDEFNKYRITWQHSGILSLLREVIKNRHLTETLLARPSGERRLTNILHLGELLQEASVQFDSKHSLVRWLAQQIAKPNLYCDNQQLRLDSDRNLVQVTTIHKSKGLEFDLVWLPFIGNFRQQQQRLYHDRHSFRALLDLNNNKDSMAWAEEERLAEDLRLLYVAVTRSIYHCSIGIAPLIQCVYKKPGVTDVHRSALGYLVQAGQPGNATYLRECLQRLTCCGIELSLVETLNEQPRQSQTIIPTKLAAKKFTRQLQDYWRVTSYTALRQDSANLMQDLLPPLGIEFAKEQVKQEEQVLTMHTFPRGAASGTFLHSLLETLDFTQIPASQWLLKKLQQKGFADYWHPVLLAWIQELLTTPLDNNGLTLAALAPTHKQPELPFYLSINHVLQSYEFDKLAKNYDPLSRNCPTLDFQQVQGMLKGCIDLVFYWQGRYYLLDYKSNWLGEDSSAYTQTAIEHAMIEHRYDLQYQLYTLVLHRYLRLRLANYDYQSHVGGVIYVFLRGIDTLHQGHSIFACRPEQAFVEGMDILFNRTAVL